MQSTETPPVALLASPAATLTPASKKRKAPAASSKKKALAAKAAKKSAKKAAATLAPAAKDKEDVDNDKASEDKGSSRLVWSEEMEDALINAIVELAEVGVRNSGFKAAQWKKLVDAVAAVTIVY